ncbi:hypothetical protein SH580_13685 [Coraliomargarita algicola]|uniref:Lipoprotein n=1 Tax=Coraliomargarita algicola TaxID=3092156 RepID=A0ABZ0RFZ6_9BACT|nr:hypothetical protein [Coraliomargarita sp. J2-16]WPJ94482.1 hypothetical protein SH580_13685 [Coraliomargarita sp. J2-16]
MRSLPNVLSRLAIPLLLTGCSVVKAPIDLATTTVKTTGQVASSACEMTGEVAGAVGSTASGIASVTRSVADIATSPVAQELALQSQGQTIKKVARKAIKRR